MQNAFELLGATPLDNGEKLKELFEEKQLLLDNDKELADAYSSLTNPKKRINHEIEYFAKEEFEPFNEIFVENTDSEQKMNIDDTCSAIINIGRWFDSDIHSIYTQINDNREISGFSKLNNSGIVSTAISELRANYVSSVTKYFEFIDEKGLVKLFNELVEYEDFTSFFMNELMAHYEIKIKDSLQKIQTQCTDKFIEIEKIARIFYIGGVINSLELENKISEFKTLIQSWDKLAQPLQVNAQLKGAEHDESAKFVLQIRNRVIDLSNKSQAPLTDLIQKTQYADQYTLMVIRKSLPQKLADSITFTESILKLFKILETVFAEVEIVAERLKQDKKDISSLKSSLNAMAKQLKDAELQAQAVRRYNSSNNGCYIATAVYGSYDCPQVWTLRRYRDNVLRKNIFGRMFIKIYYFLSPKFIKTKFFSKPIQKFTKWILDRKVKKLNLKGFKDTPYNDIKN